MWASRVVVLVVFTHISVGFHLGGHEIYYCQNLTFLDPKESDQVALVAFPSSGITWLRYLLQQATGIFTGSVYQEDELESSGLLGNVTTGVLVVRQQEPLVEPTNYTHCIILLRHPRDTVLSLYNDMHGGRWDVAPDSAFKGHEWYDFVDAMLMDWSRFYFKALSWSKGPVHIVSYEMLMQHPRSTLEDLLTFLAIKFNKDDIRCALNFKNSPFIRPKKKKYFNPFTIHQEYLANHYATVILREIKTRMEMKEDPGMQNKGL